MTAPATYGLDAGLGDYSTATGLGPRIAASGGVTHAPAASSMTTTYTVPTRNLFGAGATDGRVLLLSVLCPRDGNGNPIANCSDNDG